MCLTNLVDIAFQSTTISLSCHIPHDAVKLVEHSHHGFLFGKGLIQAWLVQNISVVLDDNEATTN